MTITYEANTEIFRLPKDREHSYTMISNEKQSFARDERLSPNAYTILSKVLSFIGMNEIGEDNSKKGWHFTISGFCTLTNMGETRVRNGLKELEQFGYFVRERIRDKLGRFQKTVYRFSETVQEAWKNRKQKSEPEKEKSSDSKNGLNPSSYPHVANPLVDEPLVAKQAQSKTNVSNTNENNYYFLSQSVSPAPALNSNVENPVENSEPERQTDGLYNEKIQEIDTLLKEKTTVSGNETLIAETAHHLSTAVSEGTVELDKVIGKLNVISDAEHSLDSFMDKLRKVCGNALKNLKYPNAKDKFIRTTVVNTLMEYVPKSDVPPVRTESALPESPAPVAEPAVKKSEDEKKKKVLTFREMLFYMRSPLLEEYGMNSEIFDNAENFGDYCGWDAEDVEAKYCVIPDFFANNRKNMENALKFLMGWNALEDGEFKSFSNCVISYLAEILETGKYSGKSTEVINVQNLISYLNYINWGGKDEYDIEHSEESMYDFMYHFFKHYCQQIEAYPPYSRNLKGYLTKMIVNYLDGEYQAYSAHTYAAMHNLEHSFQYGCKKF